MDDYRESIWGISPEDRRWFQLLTLLGRTAGSIVLTLLELEYFPASNPRSELARNIALNIGASFVASGFIAWGLLQAKELMMPIGDWIREANERRRQRLREEGRQLGLEQGRQVGLKEGREDGLKAGREEGRLEALREIYGPNYPDSEARESDQSSRPGDQDSDNGADESGTPGR